MSQKRPHSPSPSPDSFNSPSPPIYRSTPIHDRSSTFQALYSPTLSPRTLQSQSSIRTASHRILAYRTPSKQRSLSASFKPLYETGHDDDGEQYAGKKVETLMKDQDVVGVIVVARWYGGIMLGPVRFQHIEDCAREAVGKWREEMQEIERAKKRKLVVEDEEKSRQRLIGVLEERDRSIVVLRALLAEKQIERTKAADFVQAGTSSSNNFPPTAQAHDSGSPTPRPAPPPNYSAMNLQTLQRLEKARDSTISWILKEIDKVEQEQRMDASVENNGSDTAQGYESTNVTETKNISNTSTSKTESSRTEEPEANTETSGSTSQHQAIKNF